MGTRSCFGELEAGPMHLERNAAGGLRRAGEGEARAEEWSGGGWLPLCVRWVRGAECSPRPLAAGGSGGVKFVSCTARVALRLLLAVAVACESRRRPGPLPSQGAPGPNIPPSATTTLTTARYAPWQPKPHP